jgi:hypothetical protein
MRASSIIIFLFAISFSYAQQFPSELWHDGKIVLESNDTIKGQIKYDLQNDLLQIKEKNRMESFAARKILFFEIFDATVKRYRQFYALPYSPNNTYKTPVFFELLCEGKITLLCRENLEYRSVNSNYYYGSYSRLVLVNKYFLLQTNGNIESFEGSKGDWLTLMETRQVEMKDFIKKNRLEFSEKYELVRIIDYYNSLFSKKQ